MNLKFDVSSETRSRSLEVNVNHLVVAGWAGRDISSIEHHIAELKLLGVAAPSAVPLFYRVAANQLTQAATVEVVGSSTSGEVETFVFTHGGALYVSISSDHTDRALEAHSVALSKQICAKPVACSAWLLDDVLDVWDDLLLRSWVEEDGQVTLYQEGRLSALRPAVELLSRYAGSSQIPEDGFAMSCGTVAAIGGIRPSPAFTMELADEKGGRTIRHTYKAVELPVVV